MLGRAFCGGLRRARLGIDEWWWQTMQYSPWIAAQSVSECSQDGSTLQATHMTESWPLTSGARSGPEPLPP